MSKLFSILTVLAIVAFVSALRYELEVATGPQNFGKVNATLNVMLHNKQRLNHYKWNSVLTPNTNHTSKVEFVYQVGQITNVTFFFNQTIKSFDSPIVYLKHVKVVPTYYPPGGFRNQNTRKFCLRNPSQAVRKNELVNLVQCK